MTAPIIEYVATGGQTDFNVPFPYLNRSDVEVRINGLLYPLLEFPTDAIVRLAVAPGAGAFVEIRRNTTIAAQSVVFQDGAILTQEDLNLAVKQLLFKQQELNALYNNTLTRAQVRIAQANGLPVDPEDVANQIAALVLEEQVLSNFQQRIVDIDNNAALAALLSAQVDGVADSISNPLTGNSALNTALSELRVDHDALAGVVDGLIDLGNGEGIATIIANESSARVAGDNALAATIALIGAKSGDNLAFILDLSRVRVSPTESLATRLSTLQATDAANSAAITNESTARANAIAAEATARQSLGASLTTAINNESTTRAAAIVAEQNARANAISAEATARTDLAAVLTGQIGTVSAQVTSETNARVNGDTALASTISLLGAKNPAGTIFILAEDSVQLTSGGSLGTRLAGLTTSIGNVSASLVTEQTVRANADSALASDISVLSTTVGNNTASISTLSSVTNGLQARYGVSLDVNGFVTGFVQNNNGTTGTFDILASSFRVVVPGFSPQAVFTATAGGVAINGNLIVSGSITAASIATSAIETGKIAPNAVTQGGTYYNINAVSMSTSWQTAAEVTVPMVGAAAKVDFCCYVAGQGLYGGTNILYRLLRNGTEIRQGTLCLLPGEQTVYGGDIGENAYPVYFPIAGMFPFFLIDTAGISGNVTYTVQIRAPFANYSYCDFAERQMSVTEFRR